MAQWTVIGNTGVVDRPMFATSVEAGFPCSNVADSVTIVYTPTGGGDRCGGKSSVVARAQHFGDRA